MSEICECGHAEKYHHDGKGIWAKGCNQPLAMELGCPCTSFTARPDEPKGEAVMNASVCSKCGRLEEPHICKSFTNEPNGDKDEFRDVSNRLWYRIQILRRGVEKIDVREFEADFQQAVNLYTSLESQLQAERTRREEALAVADKALRWGQNISMAHRESYCDCTFCKARTEIQNILLPPAQDSATREDADQTERTSP